MKFLPLTISRLTITAPPTAVPQTTTIAFWQSFKDPCQISAKAAHLASFSTVTGIPTFFSRISTIFTLLMQKRLPPVYIKPFLESMIPGMLKAIPSISYCPLILSQISVRDWINISRESCFVGVLSFSRMEQFSVITAYLINVPPTSIAK